MGNRMVKDSLPAARKVLILAPHPDDEALGCGGTVALLNKTGVFSTVVFITYGEKLHGTPSADTAKVRKVEAERASALLGCGKTLFLGFPDGDVRNHREEIYRNLYDIVDKEKPDILFSPSPCDYHNDHIATADIAMDLMKNPGSFKVAFYEIYSTLRFTHLVDITELAGTKKRAILNYRVSLYDRPLLYVNAALGLNAQRSIFTDKDGYYEAFWIIEKPLSSQETIDWLMFRKPEL